MRRVAKWLACLSGTVLILFVAAFFGLGGMQMVRMARGPVLPTLQGVLSPASDLAYFRKAVLSNEVGPSAKEFARFAQLVDTAPPPQAADELTMIASRSLATLDNAHSTVLAPIMHRLPIRLHWTADGLIVVKARPQQAALLGQRVLSLGGKTPEEMLAAMPQLVGGGTPGWVRYRSEYFYSTPAALAFVGATVSDGAVELRTVNAEGVPQTSTVTADAKPLPGDPFWDFRDAFPGDTHLETAGWLTLLQPGQELPLYLQDSEKLFLLRDVPEHRAVYLRMNGSLNDRAETVAQFTGRVMDQVKRSLPQNIIADFRYNRGGDYTMILPLVRDLSSAVPANGRLYVITGPNTFSAGLIASSQFKRFIPDRLIVVGEEVGDRLRFRGEGLVVTLPATGIEVYLATAWDDVAGSCGWFGDCWPPNKFLLEGVGSLEPDIHVANTWASYRNGEDLLLKAVFAKIEGH